MRKGQHTSLRAFLATAIGAALLSGLAERSGLIEPARAQSEAEKRRKEQEKQKAAPPRPQPPAPPKAPPPAPKVTAPPPPKAPPPAPKVTAPPPPKVPLQQQAPPPDKRPTQFQQQPSPEKPAKPLQQSPAVKPLPSKPATAPLPEPRKEGIKRLPPPGQQGAPPPTTLQKAPPPTLQKAPSGPTGPATVAPGPQLGPGGPALKRIEEVRKGRIERLEHGGRSKVIEEPGRVIIKQDNRVVVRSNESERFLRRPGAKSERRPDGNIETFYVRRDGVRIVTVVDAHGRLLRRYRRDRDGRERNIIDNRRFHRHVAVGVGIGALGIIALNLPPPRVTIPYDRYIVDYDRASDDDLYDALDAPPIELLDRAYSLEEIRDNYELRARVRSVDVDTINFEFGAWEVPPDQYDKLERIARAILRVLERNPDAVILIAGFTDAVGSDEDNASLSDRRATAVAEVLSEQFGVPEENLVTQGYGEQYLKIDTQGPEPRNRRVSFMNVTGLMAER